MLPGHRTYFIVVLIFSLTIGFASAGSSVGSNPGLSSLPSSISWEGDSVLNGEDAGNYFDFPSESSSILDEAEAAGMVMYNTGVTVNNTTNSTSGESNVSSYQNVSANATDLLSGYASVADIIKAQDFEALQNYTSGIESSSAFSKSQTSTDSRSDRWDELFTEPQVISCGGCS
ncbi:hypothetical protein ACKUB1_17760 [Methanospirillum stamsii]|uniref:hypothetical protein n=1 Tax=Methanospirillum stamsii TaxID=1277351 RepID=UPI0011B26E29|nr:hypothetical protein [Methanospirillum stamsii]